MNALASLDPMESPGLRPSVLMVALHFLPDRTVAGLRISYWAQYLVERGCQVTVVIPKPNHDKRRQAI